VMLPSLKRHKVKYKFRTAMFSFTHYFNSLRFKYSIRSLFTVTFNLIICEIFQVLMAVSMKMMAFLGIAPYSLIEVDRCFRGTYCLRHQGPVDEAVCTSKMLVNVNETTRRYSLEGCHLQSNCMLFH
jgi:hypothetical protein